MLVFVSDKITSHPTDWIKYEYLIKIFNFLVCFRTMRAGRRMTVHFVPVYKERQCVGGGTVWTLKN